MSGCGCNIEIQDREQRRVLILLLAINGVMFLAEFGLGILSESTALIADSLDMLADAGVYGIGLYAVGRAAGHKIRAASLSGLFQILLGLGVLVDILRRAILGSEPESWMMMAVGAVALVANIACLALIARHREGEVHMRASWIFSKNDVIANLGIILGGVLVHLLDSRYPDIVIGLAIVLLVIHGGIHILREARQEARTQD
ncbi:MAG TPA: cation transporter [Gammaproteobacteria bacterium]|nr:cation transporter [Gammaproteobacteria bacterium]